MQFILTANIMLMMMFILSNIYNKIIHVCTKLANGVLLSAGRKERGWGKAIKGTKSI